MKFRTLMMTGIVLGLGTHGAMAQVGANTGVGVQPGVGVPGFGANAGATTATPNGSGVNVNTGTVTGNPNAPVTNPESGSGTPASQNPTGFGSTVKQNGLYPTTPGGGTPTPARPGFGSKPSSTGTAVPGSGVSGSGSAGGSVGGGAAGGGAAGGAGFGGR